MCVVEVEGSRHLVTSCNTKVKEGMVVNTHSERVVNSRKQVLNMLLANHDVRCFSCSKSGDCRLQDLSNEYGITKSCYPGSAAKFEAKKENPFLTYYPELCINCQRCVSTCNKVSCNGTLHNSKIGTRTLIDAPFGLGSAVCDCLCAHYPVPVKKVGMQDVFGESGSAAALVEKYGLDAKGVYKSVKEFL